MSKEPRVQHGVTSMQLRKAAEEGRVDPRPIPRPSYSWLCPGCDTLNRQRSFGLHPILLDSEIRTCPECGWEGDRHALCRAEVN